MLPIISLLVVLGLSLTITRIATIALVHTGLSRESAKFQARSAFTGCGFTTSESEKVVNHPVRRQILYLLMLCGSVGVVTAIASLMLGFLKTDEYHALLKVSVLLVGVFIIWALSGSRWFDNFLARLITWALRRFVKMEIRDYVSLFHLSDDYRIVEIMINEGDWIAGKALVDAKIRNEGILVLGIEREDGRYVGAPKGHTVINAGDRLILYGLKEAVDELDSRKAGTDGDIKHKMAEQHHKGVVQKEQVEDATSS